MKQLITESPCIAVCRLDSEGYCEGCRRSRNEIAQWGQLAPESKDAVNRRILEHAHPAVRVRLLGEARGEGQRRGGRRARLGDSEY